MLLDTKYFGQIEVGEADLLSFPQGLFGFESETDFVLLPFEGENGILLCLQSTQTPQLAFLVMNPFQLMADYAPQLQPDELAQMDAAVSQELCFYTLCAVKRPVSESTVNFKCPIVINDHTRRGMQVILDTDQYAMRQRLSDLSKKAGDASC